MINQKEIGLYVTGAKSPLPVCAAGKAWSWRPFCHSFISSAPWPTSTWRFLSSLRTGDPLLIESALRSFAALLCGVLGKPGRTTPMWPKKSPCRLRNSSLSGLGASVLFSYGFLLFSRKRIKSWNINGLFSSFLPFHCYLFWTNGFSGRFSFMSNVLLAGALPGRNRFGRRCS